MEGCLPGLATDHRIALYLLILFCLPCGGHLLAHLYTLLLSQDLLLLLLFLDLSRFCGSGVEWTWGGGRGGPYAQTMRNNRARDVLRNHLKGKTKRKES